MSEHIVHAQKHLGWGKVFFSTYPWWNCLSKLVPASQPDLCGHGLCSASLDTEDWHLTVDWLGVHGQEFLNLEGPWESGHCKPRDRKLKNRISLSSHMFSIWLAVLRIFIVESSFLYAKNLGFEEFFCWTWIFYVFSFSCSCFCDRKNQSHHMKMRARESVCMEI